MSKPVILNRFEGADGTLNLDAIEALAKAASPGPWIYVATGNFVEVANEVNGVRYGGAVWVALEDQLGGPDEPVIDKNEMRCTAPYLEACAPEIMLALIAELREAREKLDSAYETAREEAL